MYFEVQWKEWSLSKSGLKIDQIIDSKDMI